MKRYRPDHDGTHRKQYERNKKIIFATQEYCGICGRRVDFSLKFPDPMCATVDHIIPVIKGGHPSALENMQLAHLSCNRDKGTDIVQPKPPVRQSPRQLPLSSDWTRC